MYVYKCSLNVLICCYVDNVVIGVLWKVVKDIIYFFGFWFCIKDDF